MNVAAFLGSPRKNGNTELLLRETIKGIESSGVPVQIFNLNLMNISPCRDCDECAQTGICTIDDEMAQIYEAIRNADRIILASPVFFYGVSAQTKIMIDRCQAFWCEKYLLKKPIPQRKFGRKGLLLLVAGQKKDTGIDCSEECAKAFFRTISIPEHKTLSYAGIESKGAILNHPTAMKEAFKAGRELVKT